MSLILEIDCSKLYSSEVQELVKLAKEKESTNKETVKYIFKNLDKFYCSDIKDFIKKT